MSASGELATPTDCMGKLKPAGGLKLMAGGARPVPDRVTGCAPSASVTVSVPVWEPNWLALGANCTLMVQLESG